jgi:hypothetical protein
MNGKMSDMLMAANIKRDFFEVPTWHNLRPHSFVVVDGSVLLKDEYEKSKHVTLRDFPDRTGYECFVNHVHFPFDGTSNSFLTCLGFAVALLHGLADWADDRRFEVIISVGGDCTVRFHEIRSDENQMADNLDGYREEAILILSVDNPRASVA